MNKKGVEMTMSTIIIAVLVILVLIVLVLIFSKSTRNFFLGTSGCDSKNGRCMEGPRCEEGWANVFTGNPQCRAIDESQICCRQESAILGLGIDDDF